MGTKITSMTTVVKMVIGGYLGICFLVLYFKGGKEEGGTLITRSSNVSSYLVIRDETFHEIQEDGIFTFHNVCIMPDPQHRKVRIQVTNITNTVGKGYPA